MSLTIHHHPCDDVAKLWGLRALVSLGGYRGLPGYPSEIISGDDVMNLVGLGDLTEDEVNSRGLLRQLREVHADEELLASNINGNLHTSLVKLGELLGLSDVEQQVLGFALVLHSHGPLEETTDTLGELSTADVVVAVATILRVRRPLVNLALASNGLLSRSGLLRMMRGYPDTLKNKLEPLAGLVDQMFERHSDAEHLLSGYFHRATPGTLNASDYPHIERHYRLLTRYLRKATKQGLVGVNCLLYGPPGTGKSELARTLAQDIGHVLYGVALTDADGDPLHRSVRLRSYGLSQHTLARRREALVVFDEIEGVFEEDFTGILEKVGFQKAWFNRLLEQNPVPAIWISNDISDLDPAHIRRFDVVLELGVPPRSVRRSILQKYLESLPVTERWIDSVSENEELAPALVAGAARVAATVGGRTKPVEQNLELLLRGTLEAMGLNNRLVTQQKSLFPYRLDVLNPDADLDQIVQGLRRHPSARLCLYGPSGSGKSAFGAYLAQVLDRPLLVRRASDLLGPYVGETEQALALMFRQATADDAVLLLDEADSFLQERRGANHSWEVTQVNELLVQMEDYDGVFVCSTNLMDLLDQASLRRFDLRIKFGFLKFGQAWTLFQEVIQNQGRGRPDDRCQHQLARFSNLTPGDFAVVVRRNRLSSGPLTAQKLLDGLAREARFKHRSQSKPIGFTATV